MTHTYRDCRDALTRSVSVCGRPTVAAGVDGDTYKQCMRERLGISVADGADEHEDRDTGSMRCPYGQSPCALSSDSVTFCAPTAATATTATPQNVHGVAGMYGGPSILSG